jgi:hypothetical protein
MGTRTGLSIVESAKHMEKWLCTFQRFCSPGQIRSTNKSNLNPWSGCTEISRYDCMMGLSTGPTRVSLRLHDDHWRGSWPHFQSSTSYYQKRKPWDLIWMNVTTPFLSFSDSHQNFASHNIRETRRHGGNLPFSLRCSATEPLLMSKANTNPCSPGRTSRIMSRI